MKITILGSGTSHGIPVLACKCPVCLSPDPRDKRWRSSIYIEGREGEKVVIDTGPEFRLQAIRANITALDAVFLTHSHADHIYGLDDVRPFCFENPIPVYANSFTLSELKSRFSYIFNISQMGGGKPRIVPIVAENPISIGNLVFTPVPVKHGVVDILGWKVSEGLSTFVYLTDTKIIPPSSFSFIRGVNLAIIGALRASVHETHFNFREAFKVAKQINAGYTYFTHICHNFSHIEIENIFSSFCQQEDICLNMAPLYDEQELFL